MRRFFLIFLTIFCIQLRGQSFRDTAISIPILTFDFRGQKPEGDLKSRFGNDLAIGASFLVKSKKNFLFGVQSSYFFGKNVKEDVLKQMRNSDNVIIDNEGLPADVRISERGFNSFLVVGKVFPKIGGTNPNCGLTFNLGFGYLQHKVNLYDAQHKIAAIKGNLIKGYDRLSGGFAMHQFIGFTFLGNNRLVNFITGIEFYEAFTKSFRGYNYDTALPDTKRRFDMLIGLRFGWVLPLYSRGGTGTYYYY